MIIRSIVTQSDLQPITKIINREDVFFNGVDPITTSQK